MQVSQLEEFSHQLSSLQSQLAASGLPGHTPLEQAHAFVRMAQACDLMLPAQLTVASLLETVSHKLEVVEVLLERARKHEALPPEAQLAAEQEYTVTDEDYAARMEAMQDMPPAQIQRASMPR